MSSDRVHRPCCVDVGRRRERRSVAPSHHAHHLQHAQHRGHEHERSEQFKWRKVHQKGARAVVTNRRKQKANGTSVNPVWPPSGHTRTVNDDSRFARLDTGWDPQHLCRSREWRRPLRRSIWLPFSAARAVKPGRISWRWSYSAMSRRPCPVRSDRSPARGRGAAPRKEAPVSGLGGE